jgi:catechol 2,3-dioxygenase-like lactoylglutathione lyase family enzyme
MITNLNHITLAVSDVEKSFNFYHNILGFKPLCKWDKGAYFLVGDFWFCLNLDLNVKPNSDYTHYAFSLTLENFKILSEKLIDAKVEIFKQNSSEGDSLYFLDPDGYKLEIHVGNWQSRITAKKMYIGEWKSVEWFV